MSRAEQPPSGQQPPWNCAYRSALSTEAIHRRAAAAMLGRGLPSQGSGQTRRRAGRQEGVGLRPSPPTNRYPHPSAGPFPGRPGGSRSHWARRSALALTAVAIIAAGVSAAAAPLKYAPVAAWAAVCVTYLVRVWRGIAPLDARRTARNAIREDPGHATMDLMLVAAAVASLIDVVGVLATSAGLSAPARAAHGAGAVVSVALSWALIHTLFTLRYARVYHRTGSGLTFNQSEPPTYRDFAYFAFSVGMTFGATDTAVESPAMRREVLRHALLSYPFATLVLAAVVNLLVGLVP